MACGINVVGAAQLGAGEAGANVEAGTPTNEEAGAVETGDAGCADACTPPPPSEWTAASLETSAGCPPGTPGQAVVEGPKAGSCACTCGGSTTNPCTQGSNITLQIGGEGTTACGSGNLNGITITGGCKSDGSAIGSLEQR